MPDDLRPYDLPSSLAMTHSASSSSASSGSTSLASVSRRLASLDDPTDDPTLSAYASAKSSISTLVSPPASPSLHRPTLQPPSAAASSSSAAPAAGSSSSTFSMNSQQRALIPSHIAAVLDKYEVLSSAIWALAPVQDQIPAQKRFITNVRNVLELEKKELSRREAERFSSVLSKLNGNLEQKISQTTREIEALKRAEEKVRKGIQESSEKLLRAVEEAAVLDEKNTDITNLKKQLKTLLDEVFDGDKEDESIRLKMNSIKNNLKATLDELDRHVAAEAELKVAAKYMEAAILILKVLIDYDTHEEFVVARFLVEAKEMTVRAEILTQNAFSIDALLPEHRDIPDPEGATSHNPSLKIRAVMQKVQGKLDQIHQTLNFLFESIRPLKPRVRRLAEEALEAEKELARRRIEVMENCIEVVMGAVEAPAYAEEDPVGGPAGAGPGVEVGPTGRPRITDALVLVTVGPAVDVDARRPTPAPARLVSAVPTASDTLPMYQP
ncbi:hypothetical protein HDU96_002348 [Phlyctochytrium bullatum]|nr:hypothetical protein HDU96_002348 [Phlyctochytrium bullatum]